MTVATPSAARHVSSATALRRAYLDTLSAACQRLDVTPPGDGASLAEIYRVEAALRQRGLDVRETAAR